MSITSFLLRSYIVVSCIAVVSCGVFVAVETSKENRKHPVFFGMKLGNEYKPHGFKYFDFEKESAPISDYSHWLAMKFKDRERPYYFGHIKMAEYVKPEICHIKEFYGQDMAMMLLTKTSNRLVGVVVAIKCDKSEVNSKIDEVQEILTSKHENIKEVEAPDWLQTSTMLMARSPDLWTRNNKSRFVQLVDEIDNFEVSIMGILRDRGVPMMSTEKADLRFNCSQMTQYSIANWYSGVSYETHNGIVIDRVKEWQVYPTTLAEAKEDMRVLNIKEPASLDVGYVYLVFMLHDFEKYIDAEIKNQERIAESEKKRHENQLKEVQRQNESAL